MLILKLSLKNSLKIKSHLDILSLNFRLKSRPQIIALKALKLSLKS